MSDLEIPSVKCPWCQEHFEVDSLNLITLTISPDVKEKLLSGEYDQFPCPTCHRDVPYSYPILCNDIANQALIYYFPCPPPEELRDSIQSSLESFVEEAAIEVFPTGVGDDWKVCIAFGRGELETMMSDQSDEENRL